MVCSRGRNNVPQCQEDGTWTDIPRCIEHEPGEEEQVTGVCPGIPGYCSLDWPGALCEFACPVGPDIRSACTPDGTWEPYPTCQGDPRETQDGCNPCPGPNGGPRNRTAEAAGRSSGKATNSLPREVGKKLSNSGNRNRGGQNRVGGGNESRRRPQAGNGRNRPQTNNRNHSVGVENEQVLGARKNPSKPLGSSGKGQSRSQNSDKPVNSRESNQQSVGQCPGDELQACIDVCPGFTARVFGACVAGCAKRCPARK